MQESGKEARVGFEGGWLVERVTLLRFGFEGRRTRWSVGYVAGLRVREEVVFVAGE